MTTDPHDLLRAWRLEAPSHRAFRIHATYDPLSSRETLYTVDLIDHLLHRLEKGQSRSLEQAVHRAFQHFNALPDPESLENFTPGDHQTLADDISEAVAGCFSGSLSADPRHSDHTLGDYMLQSVEQAVSKAIGRYFGDYNVYLQQKSGAEE